MTLEIRSEDFKKEDKEIERMQRQLFKWLVFFVLAFFGAILVYRIIMNFI